MSAKKKTATKKTANHIAAKFDDALEIPASKTIVAVEPMEATRDDQIDDDWNEYAPPPGVEVRVMTAGGGSMSLEEADAQFSQTKDEPTVDVSEIVADEREAPEQREINELPVLGQGEPMSASDPISGTECHNIPSDAVETVTQLINGLSYVFDIAKTVRGARGLKMNDEGILRARVKKARQLIEILAGLK